MNRFVPAGVDTNTITDSGSTNTVLLVTALLALAGLVMAGLTVWYWRGTKPDPEALGPLVTMSRRGFATLDPIEQRRQLDRLRPGLSVPADEVAAGLPEMLPPLDPDPVDTGTTLDGEVDDEVDTAGLDDDAGDRQVLTTHEVEVVAARIDAGLVDEPPPVADDDDDWPDLDDWGDFDVLLDEPVAVEPVDREPVTVVDAEPRPNDDKTRSERPAGPIDPLLG